MKGCEIRRETQEELDILHLDGALDAHTFSKLEGMLRNLRMESRNKVILDCSNLEYISSAGLGAFIGFARCARENGGDLKLANMTEKIQNIVELLGFDKIIELCGTTDEAIAGFAN